MAWPNLITHCLPREPGHRCVDRCSYVMFVRDSDDLAVEEVGRDIAVMAAQRLPGGVARTGVRAGHRPWCRPVDARRGGHLERDEFDSRMVQYVLGFVTQRRHDPAEIGPLDGQR